jgi:hypothetical protein
MEVDLDSHKLTGTLNGRRGYMVCDWIRKFFVWLGDVSLCFCVHFYLKACLEGGGEELFLWCGMQTDD